MHVILSIYYEKGKLWRKCQEDVAASTNELKTNNKAHFKIQLNAIKQLLKSKRLKPFVYFRIFVILKIYIL
jgi:hypothetical protein